MSKDKGFPEIGKRLLSVRGELDQRSFSRLVNVSQQAISNYERGNLPASWAFLRRVNEDFNVNLNWLFTGQGQRDYRAGTPYAALADNRQPGWARAFLEQAAFDDSDRLELLLSIYFLYVATEPADAKARLAADLQAIVDAARLGLEDDGAEDARALLAVYDALARDDRRAAVGSLIAAGEGIERAATRHAMARARKLYLAAMGLARLQGWPTEELEASRRAGRSYRKEGRWQDAERFFTAAVDGFADESPDGAEPETNGDSGAGGELGVARARTLLGYGHVARERGEIPVARERYLAALRWALKSQDAGLRAEVYLDLACLSYRERDWQKALEFVGSGRAFAEQARDRKLLNNFKLAEALCLRERGELETAETILRLLVATGDGEQDLSILPVAAVNLVEVLIDRGKTTEAEALLERTAPLAEAHGNPRDLALRKLLRARLAAATGEEEAARTWLLDCLRFAGDYGLTAEFERAVAAFGAIDGTAPFPPVYKAV